MFQFGVSKSPIIVEHRNVSPSFTFNDTKFLPTLGNNQSKQDESTGIKAISSTPEEIEEVEEEQPKPHSSVWLPEGSYVIQAGNRTFKIPKAVLACNAEIFASLGHLPSDNGNDQLTPLTLDDDPKAFEAFWKALMKPFDSCICTKNPPLDQVLGVLLISHKYGAVDLENRARKIATEICQPDTIRKHISQAKLTSMRVVEIGTLTESKSLASVAWSVAMDEFRSGSLAVADVIRFSEQLAEPSFISEAYYETMTRGSSVWGCDRGLSGAQVETLWKLTVLYTEKYDNFVQSAHPHTGYCYGGGLCMSHFLANLGIAVNTKKLPSYDFIRRLEIASALPRESIPTSFRSFGQVSRFFLDETCRSNCATIASKALKHERDEMPRVIYDLVIASRR